MTSRSSKYDANDSIFKQPSVDNSDPTFMTYVNSSGRKKPIFSIPCWNNAERNLRRLFDET